MNSYTHGTHSLAYALTGRAHIHTGAPDIIMMVHSQTHSLTHVCNIPHENSLFRHTSTSNLTHMRTDTRAHTHTHTHSLVHIGCPHALNPSLTYTHTHTHRHTHTHTDTHRHTHTHTHT